MAITATPHELTPDEVVAVETLLAKTRRSSRTVMALLVTFFAPFLAVIAFVALYPPFWNPRLGPSVASAGITTAIALIVLLILSWRPVRRLQADLQAGRAEARVVEIASCQPQAYIVRVTLADEPGRVLALEAPAYGPDLRGSLGAGQRILLRRLPMSGKLLSLAPAQA